MKLLTILSFTISTFLLYQQNELLYEDQSIRIFKTKAYYQDREIYNSEKQLQQLLAVEATEECAVDYTYYYNPLSLVGSYYSYEYGEGGSYACGSPGSSLAVRTINISSGEAVSLGELFTEESIMQALKTDDWISKNMADYQTDTDSINSFPKLLAAINNLGLARFTMDSFTVLDYDEANARVAVRLVGAKHIGFNHHRHLQLGLWLHPKPAFEEELKNNIRFTLGNFNNGLTD